MATGPMPPCARAPKAGERIDYRQTLYAKDYLPDMDSDHIDVLLKRRGAGWIIVE